MYKINFRNAPEHKTTSFNINDRIKHDWGNSRFNRLYQGRRVHHPHHGDVRDSPHVPPFAGFWAFSLRQSQLKLIRFKSG